MAAAKLKKTSVRHDPTSRPMDGVAPFLKLGNKRSDRHYCWVYMNGEAVGEYESMGYEVEKHDPKGVTFFGMKPGAPGAPIERSGNVLMSVDMERKREIDENGPDGGSGQSYADYLDERMIKNRGMSDLLRGIGHRGRSSGEPTMSVVNETTALAPEA